MSNKLELLAPGGDVDAIKAAIVAGANAVYCGLDNFNARNRAANLSFEQLNGVIRLAHKYDCKIFLTMNVVILEQEIPALVKLLNQLVNTAIDGIIVQDLGIFNLVKKYFPSIDIHASTQMTTHNEGQILFLEKLGASRTNLSRELNLDEIKELTTVAHQHNLLTEVFVHGSLCIAFSGQCYSSSVSVGNSGNRGRCSQACRDEYQPTETGKRFPLNLKDNSAYFDLPELIDAGVDSVKIEGRIKGAHYVYTVVDSWRKQINRFIDSGELLEDDANLYKVFNRDFTNSFLKGNLSKSMFIDNPRDHSVKHAIEENNAISVVQIKEVRQTLYEDKNALGAELAANIKDLSIDKLTLTLEFSGSLGEPLKLRASLGDKEFILESDQALSIAAESPLGQQNLEKRFRSFNNANYSIASCQADLGGPNLSIAFKSLSKLKNRLACLLNNSVAVIPIQNIPKPKNHPKASNTHTLSLLISDEKDLRLCDETNADIYFKLPESFKKDSDRYIKLLGRNPRLIPWFPAVLIGKDYIEAVRILKHVKPRRIVSNNTGVAFRASEMGIEWFAGPFLNTTNSYALLTLQEDLNCSGAFISNEINRAQIRSIARPRNFKLIYSIYHPILMMTSRQCFFQQTVGCKKPAIDEGCMLSCTKATTITNVKGVSFAIDKQKGGYPSIYNDQQFLNTDIIEELPELFDEFFIDLTNIGAGSSAEKDKVQLLRHFEAMINGEQTARIQLEALVSDSTKAQYQQGL